MGYHVAPSGRLHLAASDDAAAVKAVKAAWAGLERPFDAAGWPPHDTLCDIAWIAAAALTRDGDWIEFAHDEDGDPKWKDEATAFFVAIAPFVRWGTVSFEGEDGATWSYAYVDGRLTQTGWNGYDGALEPFGEYVAFPSE
ncbi:hypothetical protein SAMN05421812_101365 [Asanoa hainanensis]|uniref:Uncharacterized protein n=1 Tax=Asanoa hainanensis TaxID=560556 RepID=A0A239GEQ5_9ACTN|nr:hypothetical protein [Asanoa hainanensis]SNS67619.1 hypothetical protein SAMN05421812_101365 [Asanoa hainanensis]